MKKQAGRPLSILNRVSDLYLGCMAFVFLLWPGTGGYAEITQQKAMLFFLLSGAYLGGTVLLRLELALVGGAGLSVKRPFDLKAHLPQLLMAAYWLFTALSTLLSPFRDTAFLGTGRYEGFVTISIYCGCFLLLCAYAKPAGWLLWVFGTGVSLNCLLSLVQLTGANPLNLYPEGMTYFDGNVLYAGQFLGTIGNVDLLSALLCVAVPVCWIGIAVLRDNKRFLLLIPLALSLFVLFRAYVEGGILGILAGTLLTVPVIAGRGTRKKYALAMAAVIVLCFAGVYAFGGRMGGFLYEASQILHGNFDDSFGSGRIYIWRNVLEVVKERPLLGGGPDTLGLRTDAAFERYDEALGILIRSKVDTAHNEYLNILVNQGLFALIAYLAALILAAVRWVRTAPEHPAAAICGGAVLAYCAQAFFGISSLITAPYFWIALACLIAGSRTGLNPRKEEVK